MGQASEASPCITWKFLRGHDSVSWQPFGGYCSFFGKANSRQQKEIGQFLSKCHLYELKTEVAQGLTPEEHQQLFQAMMILCYSPEHVVSYFLSNF